MLSLSKARNQNLKVNYYSELHFNMIIAAGYLVKLWN